MVGVVPQVELSHGDGRMPTIGLGLAPDPPVPPEITKAAVLDAIELGYRHFDTTCLYFTEQPLGEAISEALSRGLITTRDELFITSSCAGYTDCVLPAPQTTLRNLKLDYLDLYLIHWPVSSKKGVYEYPNKKNEFHPMDYKGVWVAMEECQRAGLAKAIGVSNFTFKKQSEILSDATTPPVVNQVEVNPSWQQKELIDFCKDKGVVVTTYSPLGAVGTFYGSNKIIESNVLQGITKQRGKTVPQVSLRWAIEQGITVAVKSFNKERMKQSLEIFDWELSAGDREKINGIPQSRTCKGLEYTSKFGPFRTIDELWDEEV